MDRNFAAFAIFTLLFVVSIARISLDLTPTDCKVEDSDLAVVPKYTKKSRSRRSPPFRPHRRFLWVFFFCFYAIVDHGCLWTMVGFMGSQKRHWHYRDVRFTRMWKYEERLFDRIVGGFFCVVELRENGKRKHLIKFLWGKGKVY
ncbi:hypothetical protein L1987_83285 [Smallanthus sonchifolius]|uniref:Uncharacterized protein n=1 Tax=Smallanthus sonchifolius TaxID=185202 RepID=A0ACB8YD02_9ASTR|nr:hypothetical protein L1987_83285 [Smallanthus sonchifolius]